MKINRAICKRVNCQHFTNHKRVGLRFRTTVDVTKLRPQIPKTGLCSLVVWSLYQKAFTDWNEVPPECKYVTEHGVTQ